MFRTMLGLFVLWVMLAVFLPDASAGRKLRVVATIFPLYDFARAIGGDRIDLSLLLPPGVEAHTFEPRARDIVRLNRADVFLYTGDFMEPWAADVLKGVINRDLLAVDTGRGIALMAEGGESETPDHPDEVSAAPEARAHGHHSGRDPHIWLDPVLAQAMIDTIAQAFKLKDPANGGLYLDRARAFKIRLGDLDARIRAELSSCRMNRIVYAGHFAFGYFAARYGLGHLSPYKGFSPDSEPSPKAVKEMIETVRASGAGVVFHEELIDPKVARIIAQETGARLELLHGAHNVARDSLDTATYLSIMEDNLSKLKSGLECP